MVFISDADKGLKAAVEAEFPASYHGMCVWHLSENVRTRFGAQAASFTFRLAKAKTEDAWLAVKEELRAVPNGPKAIEYLEKTEESRWVRCLFPYPRFGHTTSNIAESLNSVLRTIRGLPLLKMIDKIWLYIMTTRYKRKLSKHRGFLPNAGLNSYERRMKTGARFKVYPSGATIWQVEDLKGDRFVVQTEEGERCCDCFDPAEYGGPCAHLLAVIKAQNFDIADFFDWAYSIEAY